MRYKPFNVGDTFKHWRITKVLPPRPTLKGGLLEPWFEIAAACTGWTKEISRHSLLERMSPRGQYEHCSKCRPRPELAGCKRRDVRRTRLGNHIKAVALHRCEVVVSTGPRHTYVCSALHSPKDFAEHLADQHRIETDNPAAAFGPALNLNGGE